MSIIDAEPFPELRACQVRAIYGLRNGVAAKHRAQCLMLPTGGGKTVTAFDLIRKALAKGKRALFVADRTVLVNQASAVADRYGMSNHGVIQANHWRTRLDRPLQIASAQTLARRGWPETDLVIVDECHTLYDSVIKHIAETSAAVIGLSATPFAAGLGRIYTNLVNAGTMHELTEDGILVPMRVFRGVSADMRGAETSGGEWTDKAAEERGLQIVGDVVQEWLRHGENRKTICFGSTIAHCEELCRQFNENGIAAAVYVSDTSADECERLVTEFKKPDSVIRVLISVAKLAKGFDQPDVGCVILARPLRKSLSEVIQMVGRGLRSSPETGKVDCVARGTMILTDRGEVPIELLTTEHRVWDGDSFVAHGGAVCKGVQAVIEYDGLTATPDHKVMTDDGWKRFDEAARRGRRIVVTGIGGRPVRADGDRVEEMRGLSTQPAGGSKMPHLWNCLDGLFPQHPSPAEWMQLRLLPRQETCASSSMALSARAGSTRSLQEPSESSIRAIWRAWHRISLFLCERGRSLGGRQSRRSGSLHAVGQEEQRRALRAGESSLGFSSGKHEQHARFWWARAVHRIQEVASRSSLCGCNTQPPASDDDLRRDRPSMGHAIEQTEREVWDVLNAGPLQRFTANGRLVHNCLVLDHAQNMDRFAEDFEDIYFNGLDKLDEGEKLDKKIRRDDEEKEKSSCPKCGHSPFFKRCMKCGHERQSISLVEQVPGELQEVMIGKKKVADDRRHLWEQVCTYARQHSAPEKQRNRALALFKNMTGVFPPWSWSFESTPDVPITANTASWIRSQNIRHAKAREKTAA